MKKIASGEPLYAIHRTKQLKAKQDAVLAIIKADPGIGLDEIFNHYYSSNPANPISKRKGLSNLLLTLCANNQLIYIKGVNGYVIAN